MKTRLLHSVRFGRPKCRVISSTRFYPHRSLTTTTIRYADPSTSQKPPNEKNASTLLAIANLFPDNRGPSSTTKRSDTSDLDSLTSGLAPSRQSTRPPDPHHLHIYAHKHNTHITLTRPNRNPLLSVSTGNLNFRKAQRGTYDAAYQLGKYVMERIQQQGLLKEIDNLEVVLRDFGPGREALTKVLLGSEGRALRGRVTRVADATRIKFGGTRGEKPRRLG